MDNFDEIETPTLIPSQNNVTFDSEIYIFNWIKIYNFRIKVIAGQMRDVK